MLSLVKEDYCISDLQEGLLCLKRVEYNQDKLKASNTLVEGFAGFVTGQMESLGITGISNNTSAH